MPKVGKYVVALLVIGMVFQLPASEQKFSLDELQKWAALIRPVIKPGVILRVYDSSPFDQLKTVKARELSLIELLKAADTPEKKLQGSQKYAAWLMEKSYVNAQARMRAHDGESLEALNNQIQTYLFPAFKSIAILPEDQNKIIRAYALGYLTFEVEKEG